MSTAVPEARSFTGTSFRGQGLWACGTAVCGRRRELLAAFAGATRRSSGVPLLQIESDGSADGTHQLGAGDAKLGDAVAHQLIQQFFSTRSDAQQDAAAVAGGLLAAEQSALLHAVDQFDDAVVAE